MKLRSRGWIINNNRFYKTTGTRQIVLSPGSNFQVKKIQIISWQLFIKMISLCNCVADYQKRAPIII